MFRNPAQRTRQTWRSMRLIAILVSLIWAATPAPARAHEIPTRVLVRAFVATTGTDLVFTVRVPLEALRDLNLPLRPSGSLDVGAADSLLRQAVVQWIANYVRFEADGRALGPATIGALRVSLPSDPSFGSWDQAQAHLRGPPLDHATDVPWRQALVDVEFRYPIRLAASRLTITPELAHLGQRTTIVLRYRAPTGTERALQFQGNPGQIRLDPSPWYAAWRFIRLGFGHILDGVDHLLFLIGLILPVRRFWTLVPVVTAFTVAHSITLVAAAFGLAPDTLWFPPLVETLIAASVVWMAIENALGRPTGRRWLVAFGFGLIHGFGFAFALGETLQFAGGHLLTALVSFNLGVEFGQLAVVAVAAPVLAWLFRRAMPERAGTVLIAVVIGHTAWHWMLERGATLAAHQFEWPAGGPAHLLRFAMLSLIVAGAAWALARFSAGIARRHPRDA